METPKETQERYQND